MLDPQDTLFIGLFCGLILGYVLGTFMWFRPSARPKPAPHAEKG